MNSKGEPCKLHLPHGMKVKGKQPASLKNFHFLLDVLIIFGWIIYQSRKKGKNQESMQSSTTPDPGTVNMVCQVQK